MRLLRRDRCSGIKLGSVHFMKSFSENMENQVCTKCGGIRFNCWSSCMDCRNERARKRIERQKVNGGRHSKTQWLDLLGRSPSCAICRRLWCEVPARPDSRYKGTWTKGHVKASFHGGSEDISNIQAECYQCNFRKNAGPLKRRTD